MQTKCHQNENGTVVIVVDGTIMFGIILSRFTPTRNDFIKYSK